MRIPNIFLTPVLLTLFTAAAGSATAQVAAERVHVSVNGAFQATTNNFSNRFEFERDQEIGSTEVDYPGQGGFVFDAGAGYRFARSLGAGVSVSFFTRDDAAATSSRVPHPFFFDQFRDVDGDAENLTRTETAVHVQAMYFLDPAGPLRVVISGGPSFFNVEQDVVTEVRITETFPFDTATFASAVTAIEKESAVGFNVGADVSWMFNPSVGVGGLVRFTRASVDFNGPGDRPIGVDAGGLIVGGGLRLLF